ALVMHGEVIDLSKQSQLYKFLVRLSEEVHRFAIDFHRKTRTKKSTESLLDQISGMGEKRKKALLNHFKNLDEIKEASDETLISLGIPRKLIPKIKEVLS
ncbi:MAG: excinuclease ABC subunit C, partial [Acholeplasmataceae bacterium]|nr:excinuclease ABC subunit C [Acholeplasmataceae bacterium]